MRRQGPHDPRVHRTNTARRSLFLWQKGTEAYLCPAVEALGQMSGGVRVTPLKRLFLTNGCSFVGVHR